MTKDRDFIRLLDEQGPPPQVIWLRLGNSSSAALQQVLSTTSLHALELLRSGEPWVEIRPPRARGLSSLSIFTYGSDIKSDLDEEARSYRKCTKYPNQIRPSRTGFTSLAKTQLTQPKTGAAPTQIRDSPVFPRNTTCPRLRLP